MATAMDQCIDNCRDCHETCLKTLAHVCLKTGGQHVEPAHVIIMMDCIDICHTCMDFMIRGSSFHQSTCRACAEVCQACADSCEKVGGMEACVQSCRRCADSCHSMVM